MRLDLSQLELKYADLRVRDAGRERRLANSLLERGQQQAVLVVARGDEQYVLIDGYARVRVLEKPKRDEVEASVLAMSEAQALVTCHRLDNARQQTALEDGWMLVVLLDEHGLSLAELAEQLDRSRSWVSRRVSLVKTLPASVCEAVRAGHVSVQSATKYLVPLARANAEHCARLVAGLGKRMASVRQMERLYIGWRRGDAKARESLLSRPWLYLEAEAAAGMEPDDGSPRTEFEHALADLGALAKISLRLGARLASGRTIARDRRERMVLAMAWDRARQAFAALTAHLKDERRDDAGSGHANGDPAARQGRPRKTEDRQGTERVGERGPGGHPQRGGGGASARAP